MKRTPMKSRRRRPSDGPWRAEVLTKRGHFCRACGSSRDLQADHLIPKSQGGPSVVENGLPLCGPWGGGECHEKKTRHELLILREMLDPDQIEWLAEEGHVVWDENGEVSGRHCKLFAPVRKEKR